MNALKFALVTVVLFVAAQVTGWNLLDRLFYVLAGILVLAFVLSRFSLRGLRLHRETPTHRGQVGQVFTERLRLENTSRFGKLWVEVDDLSTLPDHHASVVTALGGRDQRQWTIQSRLRDRGRFHLGPLRLRSGDPFGLFPVQREIQGTSELVVYPAAIPLPNAIALGGELPGGNANHSRTPHITPNVSGVREYAPGDSFNRIAWSSSARAGRLMVKEFELDPTANVWLALDLEHRVHEPSGPSGSLRPPGDEPEHWRASTEEFCITVTASLGQYLLDQKRAVGLMMAGQHYEVLPTDRGPRQLMKVLEALAVIRAEGERDLGEMLTAESTRFGRYTTLIIVTPSTDETWVPALMTLMQAGVRATVILVDRSTFSGRASPLLIVSRLAALNVPTIVLRRHDNLTVALIQASALPARGRTTWRPPGAA